MIRSLRHRLAAGASFLAFALMTAPAHAAGSNMPWEQPLQQILDSIQGPVAKILSVIVIVVTGLTLAFDDTSGGFRQRGEKGNTECARVSHLDARGGSGCFVQFRQGPASSIQKALAGHGWFCAGTTSFEQRRAELLLQHLQLPTDC